MLVYNKDTMETHTEKVRKPEENEVVWIRLRNPEPAETTFVLHDLLESHHLLVEDAIKLNQRPKMDRYKNNIFISFFTIDEQCKPLEIAIVVGSNYVVTIFKDDIPVLDSLYDELQRAEGKMKYPAQILYYIMDRCVDDYVQIIDHIEDTVEQWEEAIHNDPYANISSEVFKLKRLTHGLRRTFIEERSILGSISHQNFPYSSPEADVYFVDIFDHISRVVDSIDSFRDSLTGLLEMQISMKADRMNETMKTLTIFSTIFLPLSFVVGLYGMNFKIIPELRWDFGYVYVWGVILSLVIGMILFFKKKKWI
ncbi:magnesium transport protein CorA [Paenibacillus baekrokdamisoli]|uniref:Magnesium transport protein CorA n=1 Tax=Paenibacillus baekrokdamisoli TaxID=1712516 RepID=A0A3G9IZV6_9BACL|nr:magnesium/cobalt transporter CorA [Paenibacillus baekrokdamisoli]MBB3071509.1 magnesium transporter [Paenibacillus baekrokdamisoli]BBH24460.1 magnesium transport protein CorA [Paenibacillus baekrokdamisoli]